MKEDFLHFLWQFQLFDKSKSFTSCGKHFSVLRTGIKNKNAGPDFSMASIEIDNVIWTGNIEIHIKSSGWNAHNHQLDEAYDNVILHVVWKKDQEIIRKDGTIVPTFELAEKTDISLINKYEGLISNNSVIPCVNYFPDIEKIVKLQALDFALMQRLEQKATFVQDILEKNNNNWEETAYYLLAKNFGFKVNSDPFLRLAEIVPLKSLQKHFNSLYQIEALLFGQAGLLDNNENGYSLNLKKEYEFLSNKYGLQNKQMKALEWKMLRLRPANFPTLRLAQFAAFIHQNPNIFSTLFDWGSYDDLKKSFDINTSTFWSHHYSFTSISDKPAPRFGKSSFENIVINTVVPLLVAYSKAKSSGLYIEKAIGLLEKIISEKNTITSFWEGLGLPIRTAFDSQASIELYNNFCRPRKCLSCKIGISILKQF